MPTFTYRSLKSAGRGGSETVDAPDRATAIREIMRRGEVPTAVQEVQQKGSNGTANGTARNGSAATSNGVAPAGLVKLSAWASRRAMSRAEMASFIRELATAIQAGLPLVQGLRTIAKQGRSEAQKAMLAAVISDVEQGKSLADAAAGWGKPFSELTINLLRAGDASGKLGEVMTQAADLMDRDLKLRRALMSATLYPAILAVLIILAIIIVVTVIVPSVLKNVGGQIAHLPFPTRVVQGLAHFFGGLWWGVVPGWVVIIPTVVISAIMLTRYCSRPFQRMWIDERLLRVPILGRLLRDVAVARFTRTLGTLTNAGLPVLTALKVTKGTLGNKAMERVIDEVCEQVAAGRTIADPMERSGYFPLMLVQIVNLGERSGRLDELLSQAAGAFEDRTETSIKLFTAALPPVLVVFLAGAVGFIVLSIMLPLLQMQDSIGK